MPEAPGQGPAARLYAQRLARDPNYNKKHHARHREKRNAAAKVWYKRVAAKGSEHFNTMSRNSKLRLKLRVLALFGSCCARCCFADHRALQVDHVKRAQEPRGTYGRSGYGLYRLILSGKRPLSDFQLLCANCNSIKRHEEQEFFPVVPQIVATERTEICQIQ